MAHNPLDDGDQEHLERIRTRAYHLWQSEGEKHGHEEEYWERARELVGMEESAGSGQLPNPMTVLGNDPAHGAIVEESAIQENLGEFPGQADQGEEQPYPTAAATHETQDTPTPAVAEPKPRTTKPKAPATPTPATKASTLVKEAKPVAAPAPKVAAKPALTKKKS